jgi:LPXTG-site transpeptidase (sortase) family protein
MKKFTALWEHALLAGGVVAIGYCIGVLLFAAWTQESAWREFQEELRGLGRDPAVSSEVIGRLEIPRIGLAAMVFEGSDDGVLRRGIGHLPESALPGRPGNTALTGHRDTFFRPLHDIRKKDEITLTTRRGRYSYRVEEILVVDPRDRSVLASTNGQRLTLITCYPFSYLGPAPQRFVVHAWLMPAGPPGGQRAFRLQ